MQVGWQASRTNGQTRRLIAGAVLKQLIADAAHQPIAEQLIVVAVAAAVAEAENSVDYLRDSVPSPAVVAAADATWVASAIPRTAVVTMAVAAEEVAWEADFVQNSET